ncbi:MAG: ribosomal-processing cysteine protease Prp [Lachnospiraceae bacterium]|nr:ribosomal-processing cysteine protease Prp [Lachnospiraceae bacterium]
MIKALVTRSCDKGYVSFVCSGHAEYAEPGSDIVCSAVSMLVLNTANAIEGLTDNKIKGRDNDGEIRLDFPDGLDDKGKLLMDTMIMGLEQVEKDYADFIKLSYKEV